MSRVLLHISDLHFGRIEHGLPVALAAAAQEIRPDLVAISGDLTQRARSTEFLEAKAFLDSLPKPQVVVPGNHDVPLHNLYGRFLQAFDRYQRHITPDLAPEYLDEELAVFGVNTARSLTWKGGRVTKEQIEDVRVRMCGLGPAITRIVVAHHPFDIPSRFHARNLVGSARAAFERWAGCGADVLLSGHLHVADATTTLTRYGSDHTHAIVVNAGTAVSTRGRGAANSFNVISIENRKAITIMKWCWDAERQAFIKGSQASFSRNESGWKRSDAPPSYADSSP